MVCQGYLAPDKLDPKFLDPKSVFKDVQEEPENRLNLLQPVSKKKKYVSNENRLSGFTLECIKEMIDILSPLISGQKLSAVGVGIT